MATETKTHEHRIIMGLDVSTSTIGISIALVDEKGNVKPLEVTHLRLNTPTKQKGVHSLFLKDEMFAEKLR